MKDVLEAAQAKDTGRRVKLLRKQLGWSQPQLAQFLDCTVESISKTERGLHMMKSWRLAKLCRLCGVSMDYMIFGRGLHARSYLYAVILTVIFSLSVNVFSYFYIQKIDMVESLKSVE